MRTVLVLVWVAAWLGALVTGSFAAAPDANPDNGPGGLRPPAAAPQDSGAPEKSHADRPAPDKSAADRPASGAAAKPAARPAPNSVAANNAALNGITPEQAKAALEVLNDPAKRAAFTATLTALLKAGGAAAAPPPADATQTKVEGISIPLAPDSLGAQVLVSASNFATHLGDEAMDALNAAQSLPLLWGWAVVMATNPTARDLLEDVVWRLALAVALAVAVHMTLRWAMRRPIRSLEVIAPAAEPAQYPPPPADAAAPDCIDVTLPDPPLPAQPGIAEPPADADAVAAPDPDTAAAEEIGTGEDADTYEDTPPRPPAWVLLRRLPLVLARLVLELIPVLGIIVSGHVIAASRLGGHEVSRLIILAVVDSYALCAGLLCIARMLLSPGKSRLRLLHLPDTAAAYLMYWVRRLILVAVFGYAIGEVGLLLGLSQDAHDLLQKAMGLVLHVMVAIIIIQKRRAVRQVLRAPPGRTGFGAALRNRLAAAWHWIALFLLFGVWLVWAIEVPHGFTVLLRYSVITGAVMIGARLTVVVLLGVLERTMRRETTDERTGSLNARLSVYYPVAALAVRAVIWVMSLLGLLQLYGANTFVWLMTSNLGQRMLGAGLTILLTVITAFVVWEAANASVHRHLDRLQVQAQYGRSARLRTLLPLLRTTLLICIGIFAGLTVLSEIGINVAPLLAGAGIVGVAIGFGSQKLVQDLINGIFLLLENAMQVGDFVTVSGLSGTVEALSVRAIRLRASDGSVHLIPFSAVTSVTNVNRGLGNASVTVTVAYQEDIDQVMLELKAVAAEMREEPTLSAQMLGDLQLWGVDKVDGAGVTVLGQIVCTDSGRWPVQREFNRRMKKRFQEKGIRMVNPLQRIEVSAMIPSPDTTTASTATAGTATAGSRPALPPKDQGADQGQDKRLGHEHSHAAD
ncbi:MAG TPA: mechanosensitive ion channel domain-containing protein [Rhodopila sp.]|nr:mechanosensitive ion channel domain-containing protein [Rhodopila sp.]